MTGPDPTPPPTSDPVADLNALLDQLTGPPPVAPPTPATALAPDSEPERVVVEPAFDDVDGFVRGYLAQVVERRVITGSASGVYWCPRWWAHPEAISRLYALWREWEQARLDNTMSTWWLHHCDPHLNALTGEYGPFGRCQPGKHTDPNTLPVETAPPEVLAQLPDHQPD